MRFEQRPPAQIEADIEASRVAAAKLNTIGMPVIVTLDDGRDYKTKLASLPWQLGHGVFVAKLDGVKSCYHCARIRPDTDEGALFKAYTEAFAAFGPQSVTLDLSGLELLVMVSQLQLALRHPGNKGAGAETARALARRIINHLRTISPAFGAVFERGWLEQYDVVYQAQPENAP
jgi:hypothetical protein